MNCNTRGRSHCRVYLKRGRQRIANLLAETIGLSVHLTMVIRVPIDRSGERGIWNVNLLSFTGAFPPNVTDFDLEVSLIGYFN
jgi:hypothetical protein